MSTQLKNSILQELSSSDQGLLEEEVQSRRQAHGWNELPTKKRSAMLQFLKQFKNTMVFILLVATTLSLVTPLILEGEIHSDELINAVAILVIVFLNAILGYVQESKAERAIELLSKLSSPHAKVRRNSRTEIIPARELVPGDILLIEAGDKICADGIIVTSSSLMVDEASLTGESAAEPKNACAKEHRTSGAGMVYSGTVVTLGNAEVIVSATGLNTEMGKVAALVLSTESPKTPLQKKLEVLSGRIGIIVIAICALLFAVGIVRDIGIMEMLFTAVSLAVAAVPEGLPAVVTICLAIGVQRMHKKNALIRRLDAIETLGSITVICADKTGTITQNSMEVVDEWVVEGGSSQLLTQCMASCNRAEEPDIGDPTEVALLTYQRKKGIMRVPIESEPVTFTSEEKYMITTHIIDGVTISFTKGAPEVILKLCKNSSETIVHEIERMASAGMRVLAGAIDRGNGFEFLGLIGMVDPPREGVKEAIAHAKHAGIRTVMITGDNPLTASAIARHVGIESDGVVTGIELDSMSIEDLQKSLATISVFARVLPAHKVKILEALQALGHIVAMSGDGVNDAPALKRAHVGIAMGKKGTDIARESAAIVLVDDNYATIVAAIAEGRRIYNNIRTFILFLLRTNIGEVMIIVGALFLSIPLPLLPLHILWINLVTDSFPALALAAEKGKSGIMRHPPRSPKEHILSGQTRLTIIAGLLNAGCVLSLFSLVMRIHPESLTLARSVALSTTVFFQCFMAFSTRVRHSVFVRSPVSNPWLLIGVACSIVLQIAMTQTGLHVWFKTAPLSLEIWLWSFGAATIGFLLFELWKVIEHRQHRYHAL